MMNPEPNDATASAISAMREQIDALASENTKLRRYARAGVVLGVLALGLPAVWLGIARKLPFELAELRAERVLVKHVQADGVLVKHVQVATRPDGARLVLDADDATAKLGVYAAPEDTYIELSASPDHAGALAVSPGARFQVDTLGDEATLRFSARGAGKTDGPHATLNVSGQTESATFWLMSQAAFTTIDVYPFTASLTSKHGPNYSSLSANSGGARVSAYAGLRAAGSLDVLADRDLAQASLSLTHDTKHTVGATANSAGGRLLLTDGDRSWSAAAQVPSDAATPHKEVDVRRSP